MTANKVINIALGEVGTKESPMNSNKTKYGEAYGWNAVPWCVIFLWWCFREAGMSELFYGGGKTASCGQYITWAKKNGQWITDYYKPGDLIFMEFDGDNSPDHVGICTAVTDSGVVTIEGNTSAAGSQSNGGIVLQKTRKRSVIVGAARPEYKEDEDMTGEEIYEKLNEYLKEQPIPDWAADELNEAIKAGITDGTRPMQLVPRYQAAIMALRASKK